VSLCSAVIKKTLSRDPRFYEVKASHVKPSGP
jgi:hypothetical protein